MKDRYRVFLLPLLFVANVMLWQYAAESCPLFQPFWEDVHDREANVVSRFNGLALAGVLFSSTAWSVCLFTNIKFQDEV